MNLYVACSVLSSLSWPAAWKDGCASTEITIICHCFGKSFFQLLCLLQNSRATNHRNLINLLGPYLYPPAAVPCLWGGTKLFFGWHKVSIKQINSLSLSGTLCAHITVYILPSPKITPILESIWKHYSSVFLMRGLDIGVSNIYWQYCPGADDVLMKRASFWPSLRFIVTP